MTTTVRKGTNRPAAAASRTRAAQKPTTKPTLAIALPEDFPGAKKITRLLDGTAQHGWTAALSDLNPATGAATLTVTLGEAQSGPSSSTARAPGTRSTPSPAARSAGSTTSPPSCT